jgi:hypothetical protein
MVQLSVHNGAMMLEIKCPMVVQCLAEVPNNSTMLKLSAQWLEAQCFKLAPGGSAMHKLNSQWQRDASIEHPMAV